MQVESLCVFIFITSHSSVYQASLGSSLFTGEQKVALSFLLTIGHTSSSGGRGPLPWPSSRMALTALGATGRYASSLTTELKCSSISNYSSIGTHVFMCMRV